MGSFYATCSVTSMSLTHQKTYIQLLVPSWTIEHSQKEHGDKGLICSNDGCQYMYSPFGFPIKGYYDDYGNIRGVDEDLPSVKMLEDYFGMGIYNILDEAQGAGSGECDDVDREEAMKVLSVLTCTYIRGEIYDYLTDGWGGVRPSSQAYDWYTSIEKGIRNANGAYHNEVSEEAIDELMEGSSTGQTREWYRDLLKRMGNGISGDDRTYIPSLCKYDMFKRLDIPFDRYEEDIKRQYLFIRKLSRMYKALFPSMYGSQTENWSELMGLNDKANELMQDDLMDRESQSVEWCDDDSLFVMAGSAVMRNYLKSEGYLDSNFVPEYYVMSLSEERVYCLKDCNILYSKSMDHVDIVEVDNIDDLRASIEAKKMGLV